MNYSMIRSSGTCWRSALKNYARLACRHFSSSTGSNRPAYDAIVIGSGSGGISFAREAKRFGADVALLNYVQPSAHSVQYGLGGTCVNVGCIPKKIMHHAAGLKTGFNEMSHFGWNAEHTMSLDWSALVGCVQDYIRGQNFGYKTALRDEGTHLIEKWGRVGGRAVDGSLLVECLAPPGVPELYPQGGSSDSHSGHHESARDTASIEKIHAKHVIVAVGGRPTYPEQLPGARLAITSDELFSLQRPPGRTLVVGGGYVALETAGLLNGLGFETTLAVRSIPLRGFDSEMAERVLLSLEAEGVRVLRGASPAAIRRASGEDPPPVFDSGYNYEPLRVSLQADTSQGQGSHCRDGHLDLEVDTVVMATGRHVLTGGLGLESLGVQLEPGTGKVVCYGDDDPEGRTETAVGVEGGGIHAVGDVVAGRPELTPVAARAGKLLARRLFAQLSKGQVGSSAASGASDVLSLDPSTKSSGDADPFGSLDLGALGAAPSLGLAAGSTGSSSGGGGILGGLDLTPLVPSSYGVKAGESTASAGLPAASWHDGTERMDYSCVPTAVFTPVEYACVGLSEDKAVDKHGADRVKVYCLEYDTLEMSAGHRREAQEAEARERASRKEGGPMPPPMPRCMLKIVCRAHGRDGLVDGAAGRADAGSCAHSADASPEVEEEEVLGLHVFGPGASEVMQGYAAAMSVAKQVSARLAGRGGGRSDASGMVLGMTKRELEACIGIHPTHAEEVVGADRWKGSGVSMVKSSC